MSTPSAPASGAAAPQGNTQNSGTENAINGKSDALVGTSPTPTEIRKMKLQLDGKEVELPESEVIAGYQAGKISTQRFQEAAKMRQEAEQVLKYAEANPEEFFKRTGKNARQWAEEFLLKELQNEAMSPEQKLMRQYEEENKRFKEEKKNREEIAQKEVASRMEREHMLRYDQMFTDALKKVGIPKTTKTVKRMAELQLINVKNKYELSSDQIAKLVREDYEAENKDITGSMDGDQLLEFLGADAVKKLSKAQIAKLKAKGQSQVLANQPRKSADGDATLTWEEWRKRNRGRA